MARKPNKPAGAATAPPTAATIPAAPPPNTGPKDKDERDPGAAPPTATTRPTAAPTAAETPATPPAPAKAPRVPTPATPAPAPVVAPAAPMPKRSTRTPSKGQAVATYGASKTPRHFGQVQECANKPGGLMVSVRLDGATADDEDILLPLYPCMDDEQRQQLRDGGVTAWAEWPN